MKLALSRRGRIGLIAVVALGGAVAAFLLPPLRQPEGYHRFADQRAWLGIPNILNVISNAPFLMTGWLGLRFLFAKRTADGKSLAVWGGAIFFHRAGGIAHAAISGAV
jgi:hypothetical protein